MSFIAPNSSVLNLSDTLNHYTFQNFRRNDDRKQGVISGDEIDDENDINIKNKTLELFKTLPISKIRTIQSSMGNQKHAKQRELRELVGSKYRVLLNTAESVVSMNETAQLQDQALVTLVDFNVSSKGKKNEHLFTSAKHLSKHVSTFEHNYSDFLDTYIFKDSNDFVDIKLKVVRHALVFMQGYVNKLCDEIENYETNKYESIVTMLRDIAIFHSFLETLKDDRWPLCGQMEFQILKKLKNEVKRFIVKCLLVGNYSSSKNHKGTSHRRQIKYKLENLVCALVFLNSSFSVGGKPFEISDAVEELLRIQLKWLNELFASPVIKENVFRKSMGHFKKFLKYTALIQKRLFLNSIAKTILSIDASSVLYLLDLHHRYTMLASLEFDSFFSTFQFSSKINARGLDFSKKCQDLSEQYLEMLCELVFLAMQKMVVSMDVFMATKYLRLMIINYAKYTRVPEDDIKNKDNYILDTFLKKVVEVYTERIYGLIDKELQKVFDLTTVEDVAIANIESLWKLKSNNNILQYVYDISKVSGIQSTDGKRLIMINNYFNRIRDIMNEININFYKLAYNLGDLINNKAALPTSYLENESDSGYQNNSGFDDYDDYDDDGDDISDEMIDFQLHSIFVEHYSKIFETIYVDKLRRIYFEKHVFEFLSKWIGSQDCDYVLSELFLFKENWLELQKRLSLTDTNLHLSVLNNKLYDKYTEIFNTIKNNNALKLIVVKEAILEKYIPIKYSVDEKTLAFVLLDQSVQRDISKINTYELWEEDLPVMPLYEITSNLHHINEQLLKDSNVNIFSDGSFLAARKNFMMDVFFSNMDRGLKSVIEYYKNIEDFDRNVLKKQLLETCTDIIYLSKIIKEEYENVDAFKTLERLCTKLNVEIKDIETKVIEKRINEYFLENRLIYLPLLA